MKNKISRLYSDCKLWLLMATLAVPVPAAAQLSYRLRNPLSSEITSIEGLLIALLDVFIVIATPIIVIMIIYAGFLYVTARGNEAKIGNAHAAITNAVIGGLILLGAVAIAAIVGNLVTDFRA